MMNVSCYINLTTVLRVEGEQDHWVYPAYYASLNESNLVREIIM